MRTSARSRFPCRMSSCPAACGIRCVNPSSATVSPSCTWAATASRSDMSSDRDDSRVVLREGGRGGGRGRYVAQLRQLELDVERLPLRLQVEHVRHPPGEVLAAPDAA